MRKKLSLFVVLLIGMANLVNAQGIGQTAGAFSVSLSGGASYSIPIKNLPGIKDVAPSISLDYSSQSGNGIAGWGWNISGLSSIIRTASNRFHDGGVDPVDLDEKDRFVMDGQKLILKSGTYGGNAEYQLENYSNVKVVSVASSDPYTPSYFLVYHPNGSVAKYAWDYGSDVFNYRMVSMEDAQHNTISFTYSVGYIEAIDYGGNSSAGTPNINKIKFSYNNAARTENTQFYGGMSKNISRKLDKIEVLANNLLFRKYQLEYNTTSLNYDRLIKVQEYNGSNESIAPVTFEYDTTDNGITNNSKTITSVSPAFDNGSWQYVSGYFDHDGALDFMTYPNSKDKLYRFNSSQLMNSTSNVAGGMISVPKFSDVFTSKLVLSNNKFYNLDAITTVSDGLLAMDQETVKLNNYISNTSYSSLDLAFTNTFIFPAAYNQRCYPIGGDDVYYSRIPKRYISGDFDGDGITDVLAISLPYTVYYPTICSGGPSGPVIDPNPFPGETIPTHCCQESYTMSGSSAYLLKLNATDSSDQQPMSIGYTNAISSASKLYVADFDGDGKSDLYVINSGKMYVFTVEDNVFKLVHETTDSYLNSQLNSDLPVFVADFNGDGKTDVVVPRGNANTTWFFFTANGKHFNGSSKDIGMNYYKPQVINTCYPDGSGGNLCGYMLQQYFYTFADINGDGKADAFYHDILTPYNYPQGGQAYNYPYLHYGDNYSIRDKGGVRYNIGSDAFGLPNFSGYIDGWQNNFTYGGAINKGTPIFLSNSSVTNQNLDYAFFGGDKIKYVSFKKDNRIDTSLKRIKENGITTTITYSPLVDNGSGIYTADNEEVYPFANINISPSTQIVSKVTKSANGEEKIQDYKYKGAVTNLDGLGFLGYKGIATSSVYGGDITKKLWTITKQSPQKRSANVESYLLNDFVDFNSPSNFITKSTKVYNTSLLPNKVFVNLVSQAAKIDNLTGVTKTTFYDIYDSFNNLTKLREVAPGGEKVTLFEFDNNQAGVSNQYYIGRPTKKNETQTLGSESYSTEQVFVYANNLLSQVKKKGNNTDYITEDYEYDAFGNVNKKTLTAVGIVPRIEKTQYDPSGRFVTKLTNTIGFEDNMTYDTNFGLLLSKTNHLNQAITYSYDGWQKKTKETDFYNKETKYFYDWITSGEFVNGIKLRTEAPTGAVKETFADIWGRNRVESELSINNKWINVKTEYDILDRAYKVSDPYFSTSSPTRWTSTEVDDYGRVKKITLPTGKTASSTYSGLSVTVTEGQKTQTITSDAWGNKVKMVDNGGEINYTYFANGNVKSSNYGGHVVSTEQDGWGRKTKLTDPSIDGDRTYTYDAIGQLTKEEDSKGKTTYVYDQYGRTVSKKILGDNTDISINYTYKPNGLLESEIGTANGMPNSFTYEYDDYFRTKTKVEDLAHIIVTKKYTYDGFGRIGTEFTETKSGSAVSFVNIEKLYASCGVLDKIKDITSGVIIWKKNQINEKGQILSATLGNGVQINNSYDSNYYLSGINHMNANNIAVLDNTYNFNALLGTLASRSNNSIQPGGWNETFEYDNLQRLVSWTDPSGTQTQSYDNYGRINNSSNVGDYKYDAASRYRKKGINLNAIGDSYYSVNQLQEIEYNANRLPVNISHDGIKKMIFGYNIHENRSSAMSGYEPGFLIYTKHKYYSDDKSVEAYSFNLTGRPNGTFVNKKIITYIGGDAYSAPAMQIQEFTVSGLTKTSIHYLHRDFQGSLLAITDQNGNVQERRHFDAWGNLVKLTNEAGAAIRSRSMIIERGYTGHEHLFEVGLIHMNARLYDPNLHTFLSTDNYIQDPLNTQSYNRYGYVLNNPLMYTDPSGEFAFIPILIGMAYGALVSAAIAVVTYSIPALLNGSWNLKGLGTSVLYGAISGAITGGIGAAAAQMAGSFWQSATMNMLTSVASQVGTGVAMGDSIGWGTIAAGVVSGYMGAKMSEWQAIDGNWLANATGELVYNAGKGAILGGVSGTVAAALSGKDMGEGMKRGMINGAYGAASQSFAMTVTFGATFIPDKAKLEQVEKMSKKTGVSSEGVRWRKGGLYQVLQPLWTSGGGKREVTWGNNVAVFNSTNSDTYGHEFGHIIQVRTQGWSVMQGNGIWDQVVTGQDSYITPGTNEYGAEKALQNVGGCTVFANDGNCYRLK